MPNKSKRKGYVYEKEVEADAENYGIPCRIAPLSNGRLMGFTEGVDGLLNGEYKIQMKRRAKVSNLYTPSEEVDFQIFRGDREKSFASMRYSKLLELIGRINELYLHNESLEMENKELKDRLFSELK